MNVLDFRKFHTEFCFTELLPILLHDIAERLDTKVKEIKLEKVTSNKGLKGFHYDNVTQATVKFVGLNPIIILIPKANDFDQFLVVDSQRILVMELLDDLFSVRQTNSGMLSVRFQFIKSLQSNNQGYFETIGCSLYSLYQYYFTEAELRELGIFFTTKEQPNLYPETYSGITLYSQIPVLNMNPYQKTLYLSFRNDILKKKVPSDKIKTLDSYLDPISKYLNNITSFKDVLLLTYTDLSQQNIVDLTGTNLRYKRIRNQELIMRTLYLKLLSMAKYQKQQKDIRFVPDFLLKQMFIDTPLLKLFEFIDLRNPFQELSLKYKLVLLIDHLPNDLRDVHPSFMHKICVLDTSNDDSVGSKLQLSFDAELDELGRFL